MNTNYQVDLFESFKLTYGEHTGDLLNRLHGMYRIGPDGSGEPEFGYRKFENFLPPIQLEAAKEIERLSFGWGEANAEMLDLESRLNGAEYELETIKINEDSRTREHERQIAQLQSRLDYWKEEWQKLLLLSAQKIKILEDHKQAWEDSLPQG